MWIKIRSQKARYQTHHTGKSSVLCFRMLSLHRGWYHLDLTRSLFFWISHTLRWKGRYVWKEYDNQIAFNHIQVSSASSVFFVCVLQTCLGSNPNTFEFLPFEWMADSQLFTHRNPSRSLPKESVKNSESRMCITQTLNLWYVYLHLLNFYVVNVGTVVIPYIECLGKW